MLSALLRHRLMLLTILLAAPVCNATSVSYVATNVSGSTWRYDYSITNDTLSGALDEFTIFFGSNYSGLSVADSPLDWDSIVIQPDANIPADGYYDSLSLASGLASGATASGFSVVFSWSGLGAPASQLWNVVDPQSFDILDAGLTVLKQTPPTEDPGSVPEPSTLALLALGALCLLGQKKSLFTRN